jgi:nucleoside-diphosphate-sugar epimerase
MHLKLPGIEVIQGDVRSPLDVDRAVAGTQFVYHMAALYREARHSDSAYWDVNVGGTERVLEAARRHQVERVVHCSTIGVHGGVRQIPADENSPFEPSDVYQITKLAGERRAQQMFADGLAGVVVRPAAIYGPGDLRFLKLFTMIKKGLLFMFGSGNTFLHLVYIDDLVDGLIRCAEHPHAVGKTYILGGNEYVSLNELTQLVAQAVRVRPPNRRRLPLWPLMAAAAACESICRPLGIEPVLHRRRAEFFVKDRAFSIEKARREIGYQPTVDLVTGLRRTADWYTQQDLLA